MITKISGLLVFQCNRRKKNVKYVIEHFVESGKG